MRRKFRNFKLQCFKVSIIQTDLSYQLLQTAYVKGDCTENWLFCSLINYNQSLSNPLLVIIKPKLKFKVEVGGGGEVRSIVPLSIALWLWLLQSCHARLGTSKQNCVLVHRFLHGGAAFGRCHYELQDWSARCVEEEEVSKRCWVIGSWPWSHYIIYSPWSYLVCMFFCSTASTLTSLWHWTSDPRQTCHGMLAHKHIYLEKKTSHRFFFFVSHILSFINILFPKILCLKLLGHFHKSFIEMFLGWLSTKFIQARLIQQKAL